MQLGQRGTQVGIALVRADDEPARFGDGEVDSGNPGVGVHELVTQVGASRFHQVVFQPLTDAAAAEAREYSFGFEADTETVQLRGARVYRENGQIEEAVETGEGNVDNPSIAMYSSARAYYVHFPRLNPGDVVELQYRVEDVATRNAFADYFGEVTYMQSGEPLGRAEYVLITPKSRTFHFNKPNVPGLAQTTEEKDGARNFHFVAKNVPPIQPEALAPACSELLGPVHGWTYQAGGDLARGLRGRRRDQFAPAQQGGRAGAHGWRRPGRSLRGLVRSVGAGSTRKPRLRR